MSRKTISMLPVYLLMIMIAATIGFVVCIIGLIPAVIYPKLIEPAKSRIMNKFTSEMMNFISRQMFKKRQSPVSTGGIQ